MNLLTTTLREASSSELIHWWTIAT